MRVADLLESQFPTSMRRQVNSAAAAIAADLGTYVKLEPGRVVNRIICQADVLKDDDEDLMEVAFVASVKKHLLKVFPGEKVAISTLNVHDSTSGGRMVSCIAELSPA